MEKKVIAIRETENGEKALKILYISAYFAPLKSIQKDIFLRCFSDAEVDLDTAIQLLQNEYLIQSPSEQVFLLEKKVQKEVRAFLKQNGEEKDVLTEAINLLTFHLLKDEIHPIYIDHGLSLLTCVLESNELVKISVGLPSLIVTALRRRNRLGEAYVFGRMTLKFLEKVIGERHAEILTLRHNLATILDAEGQHAKVVKVLQKFNEKDLKYLTIEELTRSLVQHTRKLCKLSLYHDALPLYQILIGEQTVLDTFESEVLTAWHDYALLLNNIGRRSDAIDILQDVLSQQKNVLVTGDEYGLLTRCSIANVFQAQENYNQALEKLKEVFHESTKFHGELHPDTLRVERDIGILLLHKRDYEEALKKLEDVEKKFKEIFPETHPDILCTRSNIIDALMNLEEYNRALQLAEDVYEAYKKLYGEKHNDTLRVKFNIGSILLKEGNLNKAVKILQEVYEEFYDVFGPEHEETLKIKAELELLGCLHLTLHAAAQDGDLNKIVSLIQNGSDINEKDFEGRTALHYAASNGHLSAAKYLIKMGAKHNAQDFRNVTPYQLASDEQMKDFLISVNNLFKDVKKGIQINIASHSELINAKDKNGYSLLHWAVYNSHKYVVQELIEAGADPKCISVKGNTPLHIACSKGHQDIAEMLLQSVTGNDLNVLIDSKTTEGGNTALHVAAKNNDIAMVNCLLTYGAVYDIENKEGLKPVQLATDQSILDLLNMIQMMFSNVREGNPDVITQLKLLNNDELSLVFKAHNSQGHALLQFAIENQNEIIIHELLELLCNLNHS